MSAGRDQWLTPVTTYRERDRVVGRVCPVGAAREPELADGPLGQQGSTVCLVGTVVASDARTGTPARLVHRAVTLAARARVSGRSAALLEASVAATRSDARAWEPAHTNGQPW